MAVTITRFSFGILQVDLKLKNLVQAAGARERYSFFIIYIPPLLLINNIRNV